MRKLLTILTLLLTLFNTQSVVAETQDTLLAKIKQAPYRSLVLSTSGRVFLTINPDRPNPFGELNRSVLFGIDRFLNIPPTNADPVERKVAIVDTPDLNEDPVRILEDPEDLTFHWLHGTAHKTRLLKIIAPTDEQYKELAVKFLQQ